MFFMIFCAFFSRIAKKNWINKFMGRVNFFEKLFDIFRCLGWVDMRREGGKGSSLGQIFEWRRKIWV